MESSGLRNTNMKDIKKFLTKLNRAFANSNSSYILEHVTDDIRWNIIGDQVIEGKDAFEKVIREMETEEAFTVEIDHIIIQENTAVVNGSITPASETGVDRVYAFCDIYHLNSTDKPLITEIISYVHELNKQGPKTLNT